MPAKKVSFTKKKRSASAGVPSVSRRKIRGKGAYTLEDGPWAKRGAKWGEKIGSMVGGPMGAFAGEWLGRRALHYPAKLMGSGEYNVISHENARLAPQVPEFNTRSEDDYVVITHREYLGDIITSSAANTFKIQSFALNPSEINTFPWLSNVAQPNYQQYKFDGLVFEFKSFSADALNSTNTALGSVFSCINYDYADPDPASRYEVENTDWSMACKPSDNMLIPVECKPKQTALGGLLYVVNGNTVPSNNDPKTYYLGKLFIGTTGFQGTNVNIGSLYVTYKIRLYKPVMTRPLSNGLIASFYRSGVVNNTIAFGNATATNQYNCDSIGLTFDNLNRITMSNKRLVIGQIYLLLVSWQGAAAACTAPGVTISSGAVGWNYFNGYTLPNISAPVPAGTNSAIMIENVAFKVLNNNADITIDFTGGIFPTGSVCQITLVQICGIPLEQIGFYTP